jgi:hypothetical protein
MRHTVKGRVQAYHRLAVVTAEPGDPIVIFSKSLSDGHHFPIYVRCCCRNATMDGQNYPPFEVFPSFPRGCKPGSDFAQADNGRAHLFLPVPREELPGRSSLPDNAFSVKVNQKCGVGYHLRPPERLPRSRSIRLSVSRFAFCGGGSSS